MDMWKILAKPLAPLAFVAAIASPVAAQNYTTAAEVRPIVGAISGSWIAVRPWEGKDLLYFTNLLSWRCGLESIEYSVNGGEPEMLVAEPCYEEEAAPNSLRVEDILPYVELPADSVQTVTVNIVYDDGEKLSVDYERAAIQIQ